MIDQEKFDRLAPLACQWAKGQEAFILKHGAPLTAGQIADAKRVGVQDWARVRVLVVDRIPLPDDKELADASSARTAGKTVSWSCISSYMWRNASAVAASRHSLANIFAIVAPAAISASAPSKTKPAAWPAKSAPPTKQRSRLRNFGSCSGGL